MSVDFKHIVRQVNTAAESVTVCQLCRRNQHCPVTEQYEVGARRTVTEVVAPDVPSLGVFFAVRGHTVHRNVVVLSHVPHCIQNSNVILFQPYCYDIYRELKADKKNENNIKRNRLSYAYYCS